MVMAQGLQAEVATFCNPDGFSAGWTGAVLPPLFAKRVTEACTDPECCMSCLLMVFETA